VALCADNLGYCRERKNMNLPGVVVDLPTLTDKDVEDLKGFALTNKVDFIAASFVRKRTDLENIRAVLGEAGAAIQIFSKIENQEGIQNFETILAESDGIMVRCC
jgi:pyruvate kinase